MKVPRCCATGHPTEAVPQAAGTPHGEPCQCRRHRRRCRSSMNSASQATDCRLPAVRPATAPRRRPSGPRHGGPRQVQERGRRQGGMAVAQQAADVPATGSHHAPQPPPTLPSPSSTKLDLDLGVEGLGRAHTTGQSCPRRCCPRVRTDFRRHAQAAAWSGGRGGGDGGIRPSRPSRRRGGRNSNGSLWPAPYLATLAA